MRHRLLAALLLSLAATPARAQDGSPATPVAVGDSLVRGDRIPAGVDTLRVVFSSDGRELAHGTLVLETRLGRRSGRATIERTERVTLNGQTIGVDTFVVARPGLALVRSRSREGSRLVALEVRGARVVGQVNTEEGSTPVDVAPGRAVFHDNAMDLILRALPLAPGRAFSLPVLDVERRVLAWRELRVSGREEVALSRGGRVRAWRVEARQGSLASTYWVSEGAQAMVRWATRTPSGDELVFTR